MVVFLLLKWFLGCVFCSSVCIFFMCECGILIISRICLFFIVCLNGFRWLFGIELLIMFEV